MIWRKEVSKFKKGVWRHSNKHASLDIKILKIVHINDERTKLKVMYISRSSGDLQYTGRGSDGYTDTVRILKSDYDNWRKIDE